ncbi:hypothetical protein DSO57_1001830 [Entomophthora muscae]|uniref:Uncharacterized protein n=1 Tax=Entomophthora muscae TaxID=34485 RepID=A0ACC2U6V4_9FUNG|nr:hypothetical protein DSO57_1001830 [Entomophthora muscae]
MSSTCPSSNSRLLLLLLIRTMKRPPPHMVQGTPEYKVDSIINHCYHFGKLQYLVLWEEYSVEESSYEPLSNLGN